MTCAQDIFPDGSDAKPSCSQGFQEKDNCHEGQRCVSTKLSRHECPLWAALSTPVYDPSRPRDYALLNCSSSPSRPLLTFARLLVPSPLADHCLGDSRASGEARVDANPISWCGTHTNWSTPTDEANVTILAGQTVTLAGCTTAIINKLDIFGTLQFVEGSDSVLRARYIHVAQAGRLEAGTLEHPFNSSARIQLLETVPLHPTPIVAWVLSFWSFSAS